MTQRAKGERKSKKMKNEGKTKGKQKQKDKGPRQAAVDCVYVSE